MIVRIDDRLIHGQVVIGWTRSAGVSHILVIDDKTAKDPIQCSPMRLAVPAGLKVEFLTVEEASKKLSGDAYQNERPMILVRGPEVILKLMEQEVDIPSLNIGNLRSAPGKTKLLSHAYAFAEEIESWKELDRKGVKIKV